MRDVRKEIGENDGWKFDTVPFGVVYDCANGTTASGAEIKNSLVPGASGPLSEGLVHRSVLPPHRKNKIQAVKVRFAQYAAKPRLVAELEQLETAGEVAFRVS